MRSISCITVGNWQLFDAAMKYLRQIKLAIAVVLICNLNSRDRAVVRALLI